MKRILYIDLPLKSVNITRGVRDGISYIKDTSGSYIDLIKMRLPVKPEISNFPFYKIELVVFKQVDKQTVDLVTNTVLSKYGIESNAVVDIQKIQKHDIVKDHLILKLYGVERDDLEMVR